jgi:hypothetical protein
VLLVHYNVGVYVCARQDASGELLNLCSVDPRIHSLGGELARLMVRLYKLLHLVLVHVALIVWVYVVQGIFTNELPSIFQVVIHRAAHH